jgi:hypothetical protein
MTLQRRSIKHCPICGVAMLASKSKPDSLDFDTLDYLRCNAAISAAPVRTAPDTTGSDSK